MAGACGGAATVQAQTAPSQPASQAITQPAPAQAQPAAAQPTPQAAPVTAPVTVPINAAAPQPVAQTAAQPTTAPTTAVTSPATEPALAPEAARLYGLLQENQMAQIRAALAPVPAHPRDIVQDETKPIPDEYKYTSVPNLARMYWAVGKFDDHDDTAIDNYLMITECRLYQQYFENDFEWKNIREAARKFLKQSLTKLPTHFEAMIPITLGKYDTDKKEFEVTRDSQKDAILHVEIDTNFIGHPICGYRGEIADYPRNVIVILNRPFTIKSVPVDPRVAELYILDSRLQFQKDSALVRMEAYKRLAYLRLRIRMVQYKETVSSSSGYMRAVIYATLDGWDVFGDEEETKPLYSYTFTKPFAPGHGFQASSGQGSDSSNYVAKGAMAIKSSR